MQLGRLDQDGLCPGCTHDANRHLHRRVQRRGNAERCAAPHSRSDRGKVEQIFVFDDFSTDRTYEVGLAHRDTPAAAKLVMKRNAQNLMYGGNQKAGYRYAIKQGLDIVILLHGDGQ